MAKKVVRKLYYFDINGIAESIRYILHYGRVQFEDVRYEFRKWPIKSVKDSLPYGQLPIYVEGDRTINQSLAIARYVATSNNLVPSDPWEQARLDAVVYNLYDFRKEMLDFIWEKDAVKKEVLKKEMLEVKVDYFFSRLEKELEENKGYFGGKLSWADFIFVGMVEGSNMFLGQEIEKKYLHATVLIDRIRSLPGVKEYIAQRKPYTLLIPKI